jgi:hypothetical protein
MLSNKLQETRRKLDTEKLFYLIINVVSPDLFLLGVFEELVGNIGKT